MKLAYLFSRYPVPSQTFCDTEMRALEAAGFEVEIWSCSPPTTSFRHGGTDDWPRARVSYAPPPEGLAWWESAARRDGRWPAATIARHEAEYGPRYEPSKRARHALYFTGLLRRQGVEHVHVHFANRATHAALFLHELTGVPFSFTAHAQDFLVDLGNDALLAEMCTRAAFVVAVSDWSQRVLVEKCPVAGAKIRRIHNGLPLDKWPEQQGRVTPDPCLRIFSLGRLIDFKGFADLIAACGILKERGIPFRCIIAGEGPLRENLQQQAEAFTDPMSQVLLPGLLTQEAVRAQLEECQVFALACRIDEKGACDVLPTVILEAMAARRPVVSTRLAGVPEMVDDGKTGLLVPAGDPVSLADALVRLANEPQLRADFAAAGRAKLTAEFSADESARQLGQLFFAARTKTGPTPVPVLGETVLCLLDRWPRSGVDERSLADLRQALPEVRFLALSTDRSPTKADVFVGPEFEFLPDAFVLETWWRASARVAHQIESWRGELGSGCATDEFLLAARRALYLYHQFQHEPVRLRHLHAVGPNAVLCAWLLVRLGNTATASFLLASPPGLTGATLRRLAPSFAGGWIISEKKLAASLGPGYGSDELAPEAWIDAIKSWSKPKPLSS